MKRMYNDFDIQEVPLSSKLFRTKVEQFLAQNGLRMECLDAYYAIFDSDGGIIAGAGLDGDIIKCVAVSESGRESGYTVPLISHIVSESASRGISLLKVFTKPMYETVFGSLGFHCIARAPEAILMENGRGLEDYCSYLNGLCRAGTSGVVVMNANPFTIGHEYLLRLAVAQVDNLFVIPVKEERSRFSYADRESMIRGCGIDGVTVAAGSAYQISAATFPTYFLKDLSAASETQMRLDLDIFGRHIAPALGVSVRFVGSEPSDPLTARYNELMLETLPSYGVQVVEIPRLCDGEVPVSASRVRSALDSGAYPAALVPPSSRPYLLAELMARALRMELDAPLKPGLIGPDSNGAHTDMDYALMRGSIDVIRQAFVSHFDPSNPVSAGRAAESELLAYTGGVNTYRGAIFCLFIMAYAALAADADRLQRRIAELALVIEPSPQSHGGVAVERYGVKGALAMARGGYAELFSDWLPFYRSVKGEEYGLQKTLLRIMGGLDDTCIIHRAGIERVREIKKNAAAALERFTPEALAGMDAEFKSSGISPGGCADMLSLVIFTDSILTNN